MCEVDRKVCFNLQQEKNVWFCDILHSWKDYCRSHFILQWEFLAQLFCSQRKQEYFVNPNFMPLIIDITFKFPQSAIGGVHTWLLPSHFSITFIPWPTGIELLLSNKTAFKLSFNEPIHNLQSDGLYPKLKTFVKPLTSKHTRSFPFLKYAVRSFFLSHYTVTWDQAIRDPLQQPSSQKIYFIFRQIQISNEIA